MSRYDKVQAELPLERAILHVLKAAETEEGVDLNADETAALAKLLNRAVMRVVPAPPLEGKPDGEVRIQGWAGEPFCESGCVLFIADVLHKTPKAKPATLVLHPAQQSVPAPNGEQK